MSAVGHRPTLTGSGKIHFAVSCPVSASTNGVFVDQRRVEKAAVRPGAIIRIGLVTLRLELTEEERDDVPEVVEVFDLDMGETQPVKIIRPDDQPDDPLE